MKNISRVLLACCLLLFAAGPALAELKVTFINRTDFEIQSIDIQGDRGGMAFSVRVVPGNFCVFTDRNSKELQEVTIDAGLMLFTFTDMKAVAGISDPTFEISFDADNRPHLTLVDKPAQTGESAAPGGGSFDLPAGPIWDNDHAKKRCPQVLEEWLAANPGKQAEWNGNWATVKPGESVCGMTLIGGGAGTGAKPSSPASPSLINVVGETTVLADPSVPVETKFSAILGAKNLGEIRAMGAQDSSMWSMEVYLPATFAGKTWAVFVASEDNFSRDDADKLGGAYLRTYTGGPEGLVLLLHGLAAEGYRPWSAQLSEGEGEDEDMDMKEKVKIWEENLSAEEAWEQVAEACLDVNRDGKPAAIDVLLLTGESYARAAKGEDPVPPGFRLRVSNAAVVTLVYLQDASELASLTR